MFLYLGHGERDYLARPIPINRRGCWEIEAVLAGRIGPTLRDAARPVLRARWLWLLPPGLAHGWTGDGRSARVAVFHLSEVPSLLREAAGDAGLGLALDASDVAALEAWAAQLRRDRQAPSSHAVLRSRLVADQLCLLAARAVPERPLIASPDRDLRLVEEAVAWLGEHLHEGVGIADAAAAIGLSPAHLRRLVHRVRGCSPRGLLAGLRLSRARELLAERRQGTAAIAAACGLASAAAFSRACRRLSGSSPSRLRSGPGAPRRD